LVYDAIGSQWTGSFYKWQLIADGYGGSSWSMLGGASADCSPYGFVYSGFSRTNSLNWEHSGTTGTYDWSNEWDVYFFDGNGGTLHDAGLYEYHPYGYNIADGWAEGRVIYTGSGTWSFWYNYGYFLGSGYGGNQLVVDCINVQTSSYSYNEYADGYGGSWISITGGMNYYSYGQFIGSCGYINYYSDGGNGYYTYDTTPTYDPYGTFEYNSDNYNYYSDGTGGVYQGEYTGGYCDPYGTGLSSGSGTHYINAGCGDWSNGVYDWTQFADGNCGTYTESSDSYEPYGTYFGNCSGYNYYSDGIGDYYAESDGSGGGGCDPFGTWIASAQSGQNYLNTGCGDFMYGYYDYNVLADGTCGSFTEINWQNWYSYGDYIGSCNDNNYYSDGTGGVYSEYVGA
jgi:hypothetical protein